MMKMKDQLRKIRASHNFTQKDVADLLGMERSTYSYYELGITMPSVDTLTRLQQIYLVSLDFLVHGREWRYPSLGSRATYASVADRNPISELSSEERMMLAYFRLLKKGEKANALNFMKKLVKESRDEDSSQETEN